MKVFCVKFSHAKLFSNERNRELVILDGDDNKLGTIKVDPPYNLDKVREAQDKALEKYKDKTNTSLVTFMDVLDYEE